MAEDDIEVYGQPHVPVQLTPEEVLENRNLVARVMKEVMRDGTDYGVIPFTDKPSLYKAGAEKLMALFKLSAQPMVTDLSLEGEYVRYRITVTLVNAPTGIIVGYGLGECSSQEEKYAWKKAVCDEEWQQAYEHKRRVKFGKKKKQNGKDMGHYEVKQVATNPADIANTVLKMAKKRALLDAVLTATAASDIFTQDKGKDGNGSRDNERPKNKAAESVSETTGGGGGDKTITEGQVKYLKGVINKAPFDEEYFKAHYGLKRLEDLPMGQMNPALEWVKAGGDIAE